MKALVLGKFMPFHQGHQALIDFALQRADKVVVLVCCSLQENIPASIRTQWIAQTYQGEARLQIIPYTYSEADLPNSSVPDLRIAEAWAQVIGQLLPDLDAICTSEAYGDNVARLLHIQHWMFDAQRKRLPVSATMIRTNPTAYWSFLPDAVKPYYQQKIILLGTESTGKSSLAEALHQQLPAALVEEAGRRIVAQSEHVTIDQLYQIVHEHDASLQAAINTLQPFVILDTDVYITQSYAHFFFGHFLTIEANIYNRQQGRRFYLSADFPYVQDGTRLDEAQRNALDIHHRHTLQIFQQSYEDITGTWQQRLEKLIHQSINN
ncbi:MAG: AAA family ATPase [Saprospiraceae bacterium]